MNIRERCIHRVGVGAGSIYRSPRPPGAIDFTWRRKPSSIFPAWWRGGKRNVSAWARALPGSAKSSRSPSRAHLRAVDI